MHIVVVGGKDPNDLSSWSGTPRSLVGSLRQSGHRVTTIGPLARPSLKVWSKEILYRQIIGKSYLSIRDPKVARARAVEASDQLRRQDSVDLVMTLHSADAAYLRCEAPIILVHDVTWHQLLDFYPFYRRSGLAIESMEGGYELDKEAFSNCAHMIFSSDWAAASAMRDYGVERTRISIQHFGPNLRHVPNRDQLQEIIGRRGRGPCRLLFVGIDWMRKGGDLAIAIAKELRGRGLPVELEIVGCNPPVSAHGVVRRFGFLSKTDSQQEHRIEQLYAEADFLLLPTRADCCPIVLSEATANGLPVAATAVGGIAEVFDRSNWGIALPLDAEAKAYANWLHDTYADRTRYQRTAWMARDVYDANLNWDAYCARIEAISDWLLEAPPPRPRLA